MSSPAAFWTTVKGTAYAWYVGARNRLVLSKSRTLRAVEDEIKRYLKYHLTYTKLEAEKIKTGIDAAELTYGETPYFTAAAILKEAKAKEGMVFYELGSGMGRFAFLANLLFRTKVVGIEIVPLFTQFTNDLVDEFKLQDISFRQENIFGGDYADADIIYMTTTCLSEESRGLLANAVGRARRGTKVITVTHALDHRRLRVKKAKRMCFSWGRTTVYFHEVVGADAAPSADPANDC